MSLHLSDDCFYDICTKEARRFVASAGGQLRLTCRKRTTATENAVNCGHFSVAAWLGVLTESRTSSVQFIVVAVLAVAGTSISARQFEARESTGDRSKRHWNLSCSPIQPAPASQRLEQSLLAGFQLNKLTLVPAQMRPSGSHLLLLLLLALLVIRTK